MINVSIPIEFFVNSMIIFFISLMFRCLDTEQFSLIRLLKDVLYSLLLGGLGVLFEDFNFLILIILFVIKEMIHQHRINIYKNRLTSFLLAIVVEITLLLICNLLGKVVFLIPIKANILRINDVYAVVSCLMNLLMVFFGVKYIKNKNLKIKEIKKEIDDLSLNSQLFLLVLFIFITFISILFIGDIEGVTSTISGVIAISYISFLGFAIYQMLNMINVYSAHQKLANELEQNRQLNEYLKNIQEQYDDLRRFKHDFKNIILSMSVDSSENASKDYEELYRELTQQREFTNDLDGKIVSEYKKITNDPLRGLVIQKFFKAKSNGIKLNVEITDNYIQIDDGVLNVVRIVGILLDNAIEETSNGLNKNIDLAFVKNDDVLEISVENPLNHSVNIKNIFKKGYSTKGENHGIGLANVSELVDKDNNLYLDTEIIDDKLRITLIILKGR